MRAYLLGYNHGTDDGYFSTLIERGGCEKAYDESLDVEYVPIDDVLEIIDKLYDTTCDRYSKVGYVESARNELRMVQQAVKALKGG